MAQIVQLAWAYLGVKLWWSVLEDVELEVEGMAFQDVGLGI